MGALFSKAPAPPAPPSPPPERNDAEVAEAARLERVRRSSARGRASTILTSGQGVAESGTAAKTLLGS